MIFWSHYITCPRKHQRRYEDNIHGWENILEAVIMERDQIARPSAASSIFLDKIPSNSHTVDRQHHVIPSGRLHLETWTLDTLNIKNPCLGSAPKQILPISFSFKVVLLLAENIKAGYRLNQ